MIAAAAAIGSEQPAALFDAVIGFVSIESVLVAVCEIFDRLTSVADTRRVA
jgi:hypothetical protein